MRPTVAAVLCSLVGAASFSFVGQAEAEQDFHPIWCPQATSYYVQLREALDPLRAATVAHDLDVAKARRQSAWGQSAQGQSARGQSAQSGHGDPPEPNTAPPVNQHDNEDQPPYTDDGNPLRPRHPSPPVPLPPAAAGQPQPAVQAAQPPSAPAGPAPVKQWTWNDPDVQDAVDQFEEKSPLLYRRINTLVAETWWAELQDAGSALSAKFGEIIGDERDHVSAQDLTRDWISLEEQYDVIKNLCVGWGETAQPGVAPPGQPEWPAGSSPDTARPPGIENTAWPHTPGWVDVAVPDPDDPDAPPPAHRPYPPPADAQPAPLAHQGCERYDYRSGGWGQYPFCPGEGPDDDNPGPGAQDSPDGSGE